MAYECLFYSRPGKGVESICYVQRANATSSPITDSSGSRVRLRRGWMSTVLRCSTRGGGGQRLLARRTCSPHRENKLGGTPRAIPQGVHSCAAGLAERKPTSFEASVKQSQKLVSQSTRGQEPDAAWYAVRLRSRVFGLKLLDGCRKFLPRD